MSTTSYDCEELPCSTQQHHDTLFHLYQETNVSVPKTPESTTTCGHFYTDFFHRHLRLVDSSLVAAAPQTLKDEASDNDHT